jgi:hypothetical protein
MAAMLDETPAQTARRLATETRGMRAATDRGTLRISRSRPPIMKTPGEWADEMGRRLRGYGSLQLGPVPDPYAKVTSVEPYSACPFDDPGYNPRGEAPDGFAIALEHAQHQKENR